MTLGQQSSAFELLRDGPNVSYGASAICVAFGSRAKAWTPSTRAPRGCHEMKQCAKKFGVVRRGAANLRGEFSRMLLYEI